MANLTPKHFYIGNDMTANTVTVSSNAGSYAIIKNINMCNFTFSAATCSLYLLANSNTSASNNNAIFQSFTVAPNETISYNGIIVLPAESILFLEQANPDITVSISGVEYAT